MAQLNTNLSGYACKNDRVRGGQLGPVIVSAQTTKERTEAATSREADALCNEAMDDRSSSGRVVGQDADPANLPPKAGSESYATKTDAGVTPLMRALTLLRQSAAHWAESGDPNDPLPADVLNQILAIAQAAADPSEN